MPNFGNDIFAGYAGLLSAPGIIFGSPGTNIGVPALSGWLVSSSVYCGGGGMATFPIHFAVYSDNAGRPLNLLSQTSVVTAPAFHLGWITAPHPGAVPITAGTPYWTVMSHGHAGNIQIWNRGGGSRVYGIGNLPPAPFINPYPGGGGLDAFEYATYSTYTLTPPASGDAGPWGTCNCDCMKI